MGRKRGSVNWRGTCAPVGSASATKDRGIPRWTTKMAMMVVADAQAIIAGCLATEPRPPEESASIMYPTAKEQR